MFFKLVLEGIRYAYMDDIYVILLFIGIIASIDYTFERKYSELKTMMGWMAAIIGLYFLCRLLYATQNILLYSNEAFFSAHPVLYDLCQGFGVWMYLVQLSVLAIGTQVLYRCHITVNLFAASVIYLFVSMISDYCMPLLLVVIHPAIGDSGYYVNFETGGGIFYPLIGAGIALILYLVYRWFLAGIVKKILLLSKRQLQRLLLIPISAYLAYSMIYLLMNYVDVYAGVPGRVIYFALIFGVILAIYLILFAALFYGIISTIEFARVDAELHIAAGIQKESLPQPFREWSKDGRVEVEAYIKPARAVSGDFFDYFYLDENRLAVVIADVSGKGISSSLMMMKVKTLIADNASHTGDPAEILTNVNTRLVEKNVLKMFVTAFLGILDIRTGVFTYANAGHNYPMVKRAGEFEIVQTGNGLVLGGMKSTVYHNESIKLERGEQVFLYTDGVNEALNRKGELFGSTRLLRVLNNIADENPTTRDFLKRISEEMEKYTNQAEQSDDMAMLTLFLAEVTS